MSAGGSEYTGGGGQNNFGGQRIACLLPNRVGCCSETRVESCVESHQHTPIFALMGETSTTVALDALSKDGILDDTRDESPQKTHLVMLDLIPILVQGWGTNREYTAVRRLVVPERTRRPPARVQQRTRPMQHRRAWRLGPFESSYSKSRPCGWPCAQPHTCAMNRAVCERTAGPVPLPQPRGGVGIRCSTLHEPSTLKGKIKHAVTINHVNRVRGCILRQTPAYGVSARCRPVSLARILPRDSPLRRISRVPWEV